MKTKFARLAVFVCLFAAAVFLAGCQPVSQDGGYRGGGSTSGGSSDGSGNPGAPTLTPDELQILGIYRNASGKSLEFKEDKSGKIASGAITNVRAAFSEITSGTFSWSAKGKQITLVMDKSRENFTATFNPDNYSITIESETFRLEGAPLEIPPDEIPDQSSNDPTLSGEINLEKRNAVSRLVIVSAPDFSNSDILKKYINHKKTQGFAVVHLPSVGESDERIRSKLNDEYQKCKTADTPMAVLLVGDMGNGGVAKAILFLLMLALLANMLIRQISIMATLMMTGCKK